LSASHTFSRQWTGSLVHTRSGLDAFGEEKSLRVPTFVPRRTGPTRPIVKVLSPVRKVRAASENRFVWSGKAPDSYWHLSTDLPEMVVNEQLVTSTGK